MTLPIHRRPCQPWLVVVVVVAAVAAGALPAATAPPPPSLSSSFSLTSPSQLEARLGVGGGAPLWLQLAPTLAAAGLPAAHPHLLPATAAAQQAQGTDARLGTFTDVFVDWLVPPAVGGQGAGPWVRTGLRRFAEHGDIGLLTLTVLRQIAPFNSSSSSPGPDPNAPLVAFPSICTAPPAPLLTPALGYAFWSGIQGLWPEPAVGRNISGAFAALSRAQRRDGPVLFSAPASAANPDERLSLLLGPLDDPLNTIFAPGRAAGAAAAGAGQPTLDFGLAAAIREPLPANHSYSMLVVAGAGPTQTLNRYGQLTRLLLRGSAAPVPRLPDPFVQKLSYWTDNGAVSLLVAVYSSLNPSSLSLPPTSHP